MYYFLKDFQALADTDFFKAVPRLLCCNTVTETNP